MEILVQLKSLLMWVWTLEGTLYSTISLAIMSLLITTSKYIHDHFSKFL